MLDFVVIVASTLIAYLVGFARGVRAARRVVAASGRRYVMAVDLAADKAAADRAAVAAEFTEPSR